VLVENHIDKRNTLQLDPTRIVLRKVMDMNARELRKIVVGLGGRKDGGVPHESGFDITVASEIMAIMALSKDMADLRKRLSKIVVGYTYDNKPVTADKLKGIGAMCLLLKDAMAPNLVQTLEGQPAFVHGAPFANIAHGNSSIIATKYALKMADYVITEGGFAADLGGEKFYDIVCRTANLKPDVAVLVSSVRALKMHGGMTDEELDALLKKKTPSKEEEKKHLEYLEKGFANLDKHIENMHKFGMPVVVALNRFPTDTEAELDLCKKHCDKLGVRSAHSRVFAEGGKGGVELAKAVLECIEKEKSNFHVLYDEKLPIKKKIEIIAKEIYGADGVVYVGTASQNIATIEKNGNDKLPLCMAKTQLSLTDDPKVKGAPKGWKLSVREVRLSAGAGFIVPLTGEMSTMPGLPVEPVAEKINIDDKGYITGLN
jgi:formate--tetrahydrofolate ligase